jgi:hypothetical protein
VKKCHAVKYFFKDFYIGKAAELSFLGNAYHLITSLIKRFTWILIRVSLGVLIYVTAKAPASFTGCFVLASPSSG